MMEEEIHQHGKLQLDGKSIDGFFSESLQKLNSGSSNSKEAKPLLDKVRLKEVPEKLHFIGELWRQSQTKPRIGQNLVHLYIFAIQDLPNQCKGIVNDFLGRWFGVSGEGK
jgi:hypothetical protein